MSGSGEDERDELERLAERYFELRRRGGAEDLEAFARGHPALADEIRALFPTLELLEDATREDSGPPVGAQLGPYCVLSELGSGGQARVLLAEDLRLGRRVALKLPHPPFSRAALERFRREAEVTSRLEHPAICAIHDVGEHEGQPYIAMRHVEGASLAWLLARSETPPLARSARAAGPSPALATIPDLLQLFETCARALHAAHEAGVLHRDVKPANIMVTPEGAPVLLDFGLARLDAAPRLTRTGAAFGTPPYLSPEQVRGEELDRRSDVYALGVTLYEACALRTPFAGASRESLYLAILREAPPPARSLNPAVSRDLAVVLERALEKEPAARYATAEELADDLRAVRLGMPIRARPVSTAERLARWAHREPGAALLLALLSLLALLAAGLGGALVSRLPDMRAARTMLEERELERAIDEALMLLMQGERARAAPLFESVLARRPGSLEAVAGLAATHLGLWPSMFSDDQDARAALEVLDRHTAAVDDPALDWVRALALRATGDGVAADALEARLQDEVPRPAIRHYFDGIEPNLRGWRKDEVAAREAQRHFQAAVTRSAARPRLAYYWALGEAAGHAGDLEVGRATAEAIEELWPEDPLAWLAIAGCWNDERTWELALRADRRALELDPTLAYGWTRLAMREVEMGGYTLEAARAALPLADKALELQPDFAYGLFCQGWLLHRLGRLDEAGVAARRALALAPGEAYYQNLLGMVLESRIRLEGGDLGEVVELYRSAIRGGLERNGPRARLTLVLLELGALEEAEQSARRQIELEPPGADLTRFVRGFAERDAESTARALLQESARRWPDSPQAWNALAWFLVAPTPAGLRGGREEALDAARRAVELTAREDADCLNTLGVALYRAGRHAEAIDVLEEARRSRAERGQPADPFDLVYLALARQELGERARAGELLAEAHALAGAASGELALALAEAEARLGER